MTPTDAQAALDRRAAVAILAGAVVGQLPLLWLIREALDRYQEAIRAYEVARLSGSTADLTAPVQPRALLLDRIQLLSTGGHTLVLVPDNDSRLLLEQDSFGSYVRSHEVPNAALVLHDSVKDDPMRAEAMLVAIESATNGIVP